MVFKNIQAILIPGFSIITNFLDKPKISWWENFTKFRTRGIFENFLKIEAFQSTQKSGELNGREKNMNKKINQI